MAPNFTVERAVKRIADGRPRKEEQSQATRLMAIGFGEDVELWHSANGMGHASVWVDGHLEHYRIKSNAFEGWLRVLDNGVDVDIRCVIGPDTWAKVC
jgi:hypothetical protein